MNNTAPFNPIKSINTFENKSAAIIKLSAYPNIFLYVVKFLDEEISKYLLEQGKMKDFPDITKRQ